MSEIRRLLIHPNHQHRFGPVNDVWLEWEKLSATKVIPNGAYSALLDTSLLNIIGSNGQFLVDTKLEIGGSYTNHCVWNCLDSLSTHPRVKNRDVQLILCRDALNPSSQKVIDKTIEKIYRDHEVTILQIISAILV